MPRALRKRRTREHVIADLSINFVERQALLCGHSAERVVHDYGYDLLLFTYNSSGELENGSILLQVKATDHLRIHTRRQAISFPLESSDLRLWLGEQMPVILVIYDAQAERAYWLDVQTYFARERSSDIIPGLGARTVHLPLANCLDAGGVQTITKIKNDRVAQSLERFGRYD
jgi:hypothetical protein